MVWFNVYERCPCCGEYLWFELGYKSPEDYAMDSYYMYCRVRYLPNYDIIEVEEIVDVQ